MNLGPTSSITIEEINELIRKDSLWYESDERFVIVEKFESDKYTKGYDSNRNQAIRFVNSVGEMHRNNGNPSFFSDHMIMWHKNGKSHRKHGKPSIIRNTNKKEATAGYNDWLYDLGTPTKEYWINGHLHRDNDLPAVVFLNKDTHSYWLINGNLHRENGKPSIINGNFLHYHNNGILYKSEIKYNNKLVDWIIKNPFKLSAIFFISIMLLAIFLI